MHKYAKYIGLAVITLAVLVGLAAFLRSTAEDHEQAEMQKEEKQTQQVSSQSEESGLDIQVIRRGNGDVAEMGDAVSIRYRGLLEDGTVFDENLDKDPLTFQLGAGQVIEGMERGVEGMKVGEVRRLTISPELAYGEQGTPNGPIPPNATLIFEVQLLNVQ